MRRNVVSCRLALSNSSLGPNRGGLAPGYSTPKKVPVSLARDTPSACKCLGPVVGLPAESTSCTSAAPPSCPESASIITPQKPSLHIPHIEGAYSCYCPPQADSC